MMVASETLVLDIDDLAGTESFGRRLGAALFPGAVIALIGPLGAGKTHLVRAVAEGLEIVDSRVVSSPTFVLIQEYNARLPIYHFDAYRLEGPGEFLELGVYEYFEGQGVCLVEWADRVEGAIPPEHLRLTLSIAGPTSRRLCAEGQGDRYAELVRRLHLTPDPSLCGGERGE
jgi:tRNA threonylcarbamoyladenosine biosynthesis protein TsaE